VIVVFDGVKLLDAAGPAEVFAEANRFGAKYALQIASVDGRDVTTSIGTRFPVNGANFVIRIRRYGRRRRRRQSGRTADRPRTRRGAQNRAGPNPTFGVGVYRFVHLGAGGAAWPARHHTLAACRTPCACLSRCVCRTGRDLYPRRRCVHLGGCVVGHRPRFWRWSKWITAPSWSVTWRVAGGVSQTRRRTIAVLCPGRGRPTAGFSALGGHRCNHRGPGHRSQREKACGPGIAECSPADPAVQSELGTTPARYVELVRIDFARTALEAGQTVAETARVAGFGSTETLRRVFLNHLGITPKAYRDRFRTTSAENLSAAM